MNTTQTDPVKQQVAQHWDRRAAHFDEDFGHSIGGPAERAAWDRILDMVIPSGRADQGTNRGVRRRLRHRVSQS